MKNGYKDEKGNNIIGLIKEIYTEDDNLVIKMIDGSLMYQDNTEENYRTALNLMTTQAEERQKSSLQKDSKKKMIGSLIPGSICTTMLGVAALSSNVVIDTPLDIALTGAFVAGAVTSYGFALKNKAVLSELDKYACFLQIKSDLYELYTTSSSNHIKENLFAGTRINKLITINDLDACTKEDILKIAKNIETIKAIGDIFVDADKNPIVIKK